MLCLANNVDYIEYIAAGKPERSELCPPPIVPLPVGGIRAHPHLITVHFRPKIGSYRPHPPSPLLLLLSP